MDLKDIAAIALDEAAVEDASYFNGVKRLMVEQPKRKPRPSELEAHDRKYHPHGYKEGDRCKYRENLAKGDNADRIDPEDVEGELVAGVTWPDTGIMVEVADITKQDVDAIVNAANRWMLGGSGVDGAIHRAAGPQLVAECRKYPADENGYRVQTGEAKITGAGNLPAKYVIHTAGPDVREYTRRPEASLEGDWWSFPNLANETLFGSSEPEDWGELDRLLGNSYRNSLQLAADNGAKSVALPSISTGIYGFPVERAAGIAAKEIVDFRRKHPDVTVKMCIYDPSPVETTRNMNAYTKAFADLNAKRGDVSTSSSADSTSPATAGFTLHEQRPHQPDPKSPAQDAAPSPTDGNQPKNPAQMTDLQKHDAIYHPHGYKPGDKCKYRENLAKGDDADKIDPENVDGEEKEGDAISAGIQKAEADLKAKIASLGKPGSASLGDIQGSLDDYEKAYDVATGNTPGAKALAALAKKSGGGAMAAILNRQLAAVKATSAAKNLPAGTQTPQDMRNEMALALAKMLGANLEVPQAAPSAKPEAPTPAAAAANPAPVAPAAPTAAAQPPISAQLGPNPALPHNLTALPAGMNLSDFNKWPRAGGSTGLRKYTDPNTGKSYGVKHSGGMSGGVNIPADAIVEDWLADQMLRMAGFNAPDGIVVEGPSGEIYKVSEWNDNLARGIGGGNANTRETAQLKSVYPLMALLYNQDASQNNDNMMVDINGDIVFTDNGSSLGNRAQGGQIKWYFGRDDADSTKSDKGVMQLMQHEDQGMWRKAFGLSGQVGSYGGTAPAASQDKVLQEAAKYNMSDLVDEALRNLAQAGVEYGSKDTITKWNNLKKWAKSLDTLSAKYKQQSPAQNASATPAQPAQQPASSASASSAPSSAKTAASAPAQPKSSGTPIYPSGTALYNTWVTQFGGANASSWAPTGNGRQSRNAAGFLNAVAAIPRQTTSPMGHAVSTALSSILKGKFTANGSGMGGIVTGVNIPRKGVQAVGKALNQLLNPQGYKVQIHNNGNVSIGLSNHGIAAQAMQAAGVSTAPSQTASSPSAAANPASSAPSASASAPAANGAVPSPSMAQRQAWLKGIKPHPGSVKIGNTWQQQGLPPAVASAFKNKVLGPTFTYSLTTGPSAGSYVLALVPGYTYAQGAAQLAVSNAPSIAGYTKSAMQSGGGVLYTPVNTPQSPSAPQSSAQSAAAPSPNPPPAGAANPTTQGANGRWQSRLAKMQQSAGNQKLNSAYGSVSNWLNGGNAPAQGNGQ